MCGVGLEALSGSSTLFLTRRRKKESSLFCFCTRGVGVESVLCECLRREFLCVYIYRRCVTVSGFFVVVVVGFGVQCFCLQPQVQYLWSCRGGVRYRGFEHGSVLLLSDVNWS